MPTLVIDAGHSGPIEPGACHRSGLCEASVTLRASKMLVNKLERRGYTVIPTRTGPINNDLLGWRAELANDNNADLFVSLHCNAANSQYAEGHEVWTSPGQTDSDMAATAIFKRVCEEFPELDARVDLGDGDPDKEAKFTVLTRTNCPAVLYELAFISNDVEAGLLADDAFLDRYMEAIARGIDDYFGGVN